MQKRIFILISATTLAITAAAQVGAIDPFGSRSGQALNRPGSEHDYEQEHEKKQKYTCPMHPEVITDHPGNCPKCGMTLVPIKEQKHRTSNSDKSRAGVQRSTSKVGAIDPIAQATTHDHAPSLAAATHGAAGEHEDADGNAFVHRPCRSHEPRRLRNQLAAGFVADVWQNVHVR